jgi:hypothetical protein
LITGLEIKWFDCNQIAWAFKAPELILSGNSMVWVFECAFSDPHCKVILMMKQQLNLRTKL